MPKAKTQKELEIKKSVEQTLAPIDSVRVEKNLISLGFFSSTVKNRKKGEVKRIEFKSIREKKLVNIEVIIAPIALYEIPTTADQDKYMAFLKIVDNIRLRTGKIENPITFTSYELLKMLGIDETAGKNYKEVENWLHKMKTTNIISKGAVYFAGRKKYSSEAVSVFSRVKTVGEELENGKIADRNYVWLSDWQLENFNEHYLLPIDYEIYNSLKNSTSKILSPFLQIWLYTTFDKGVFEKDYEDICNLVGIKTYKYLSKIKEKLSPSLNELVSCGTLKKWAIKKKADRSGFKVVFWHGDKFLQNQQQRRKRKIKSKQNYLVQEKSEDIELIKILTDVFQITRTKATELVKKYPNETKQQIAAFEFRDKKLENKSGFLIKAIEDKFALPDAFVEKLQDREVQSNNEKHQKLIDACKICDDIGIRNIKSDMDTFFGLGRECTHEPKIEEEFEEHII